MEDFFNYSILDNSIKSWLIALALIAVIYVIIRVVSATLIGYLLKLLTKIGRNVHKEAFHNNIVIPFRKYLFLSLVYVVFAQKLSAPALFQENFLKHPIGSIFDSIASAVIIFYFMRLCMGIVNFAGIVISERATDNKRRSVGQLVGLMRSLLRVVIVIIGGLLILRSSFNYNIGNLLTGLSLVTAALALAAKESLENLIASFIISIDQPFLIGDSVKVQGYSGAVESIGMRSTRLRTDGKTLVTVPNKQMVDSIVDNVSMQVQRRVSFMLEIDLSTDGKDLESAIAAIKNILKQHVKEGIDSYTLYLKETGSNAHKISLEYYTNIRLALSEHNALCQTINLEIIALLQQSNIQFAAQSSTIEVVNAGK